MKFSAVAAVAALAIGAQAGSNVTYVTDVVTAYTTYCPEATSVVVGGKTYTVSSATTLTITDCPCTITKPVITTSAVASSSPAPVYKNTTTPAGVTPTTSKPAGTGAATTSAKATYTAGASKFAVSGGALAGLLGLAALAL